MLWVPLLVLSTAPVQVAAPGLQASGVPPEVSQALFDRLVSRLAQSGRVRVTTSQDIGQVLGLERQRQLLGCGDESTSCLAELAGALGSDAVLSGTLVKVGSSFSITFRLVNGRSGALLGAFTHRAKNEDDLQDWLDAQPPLVEAKLLETFRGADAPVAVARSAGGGRAWPWVTGGASAAVAAAGVGVFFAGKADYDALGRATTLPELERLRTDGSFKESAGVGLMVAGGVGLAATVALAVLLPDGDGPKAAVVPVHQGAGLVVSGVWP